MSSVLRALSFVPLLAVGGPFVSFAQTTSTLSGQVGDAVTSAPLVGATVQVFIADTSYGTTTDANGDFHLTDIPTGIHRVRASFVGYAPAEYAEVWVRLGKEEVVRFALQRAVSELGEVEVRAIAPQRMNTLSAHTLTVEQSLRYPATFFDPARLAMSFAGVASTNDQANHFSVRGNGPAGNAWLLEGAEIVNPNHLTNAGTASDYPTLSGGGTTILSAQMLGTSRLLTGGLSAPYGNALGGLMDLQLRPGTTARQAFTVQAGLIGIDLSAEGPFRKGGKASYLINYRYSTLGLLSAMGVALGDEAITFQDLSFNVSLPMGDKALLTLFGMGGNSSNRFDAKDSTEWEFDKDSQNIDYTAQVGAAGITFRKAVGSNAVWRTTAVLSRNDQERVEEGPFFARRGGTLTERSMLSEQKLTLVSYLRGRHGVRLSYQAGASLMERKIDKDDVVISEDVMGWLLRPYAEAGYALTDRLKAELGLAYSVYTFNGSEVIEPRLALRWSMRHGRSLSLAAGQRGQLPQVQLFPARNFAFAGLFNNSQVGMTRAQDIVLAYDHPFKPHLVLHAEAYVQELIHVPVGERSTLLPVQGDAVSIVNAWDAPYYMQLNSRGRAFNRGFEIALNHSFDRGLFYQVNGSVIDADYTDLAGATYNSRWNTTAMGNLIVGREFMKGKEGTKRTWGVNGRVNITGGQRYTPLPDTTIVVPEPWSAQYATYYRIDLRVYRKLERKGRTGMWALDLLNVTNAQNEAFRYFDGRKGEVVTKYQLGLIPSLSYRIEF